MRNKIVRISLSLVLLVVCLIVVIRMRITRSYPVAVSYPSSQQTKPKQEEKGQQKSFDEKKDTLKDPATDFPPDSLPVTEPASSEDERADVVAENAPEEIWVQFPLELNQASLEELELIPNVGEVTAERIVEYRHQLGGYGTLEQLKDVKGIGDKKYAEISAYLYLTGDRWDQQRNS